MTRRLLLALPVVAAAAKGQATAASDPEFTYRMLNGRLWNRISREQKGFYLLGIRDLLEIQAPEKGQPRCDPKSPEWAEGFSPGEYIEVIDSVYREPENRPIPIPALINLYCTPKLNGRLETALLEKTLLSLRSLFATRK